VLMHIHKKYGGPGAALRITGINDPAAK
jgi:hypothetical protein